MRIVLLASLLAVAGSLMAQAPDTAWVRTYNGISDSGAVANGCCLDENGFLYITGRSFTRLSGGGSALVVKYHPVTGERLWTSSYWGPANGSAQGLRCVADNGSVFIVGSIDYNSSFPGYQNTLVIRYDAVTGDSIWVREYNSPLNNTEQAFGCDVDSAGNLYISGYRSGGDEAFLIIKYDAITGDTAWVRNYSTGSQPRAFTCRYHPSGHLYVAGLESGTSAENFLIIKYDAVTGDSVWARTYHLERWHYMSSLMGCSILDGGNIVVAGEIGIVQFSPENDSIWTVGTSAYGCAVGGDGGMYTVGSYFNPINSSSDVSVLKLDPEDGDTVWMASFAGSGNSLDVGNDCRLDSAGNIYLAGFSAADGVFSTLVIRYNGASGVAEQDGSNNGDYYPSLRLKVIGNRIEYFLAKPGYVSCQAYDISGRLIASITGGVEAEGRHTVVWNGKTSAGVNVPSGLYLIRLRHENLEGTGRLLIVR